MDASEPSPERRTQKQKRPVARWVAFVAGCVLCAGCVWAIFLPHETKTSQPVTLDHAGGCPIPLPPTAHSIQFYERSQFNFFSEFVRFEAPVDDCIEHVQSVRAAWGKEVDYLRDRFGPLRSLAEPPPARTIAQERGVTWFDPQNIREGLAAGGGGSGIPMIWVDTERGVFYYELSD